MPARVIGHEVCAQIEIVTNKQFNGVRLLRSRTPEISLKRANVVLFQQFSCDSSSLA